METSLEMGSCISYRQHRFPNDKACVDFIDKFLNFQSKSYLREFKLSIDQKESNFANDASLYGPCLGKMDKRKIQRFQVESRLRDWGVNDNETHLTLSVCEALVCLKLHHVRLNEFESLSLPCLKIMYLEDVILPSDAAAEALIGCSPVLEDLKISLHKYDFVVHLRVCSQSLKSFTLKRAEPVYSIRCGHSVVMDTPRLEYLSLIDYQFRSFKIISMGDSVKADIDVDFEVILDYLSERTVFYNFLSNFSRVGDMTISWRTLKLIYGSRDMDPLPMFHGLTRLRAAMCTNASYELLPIVLDSCPNLKHLTVELISDYPVAVIPERWTMPLVPYCLGSSLEFVEMESSITELETELDLVNFFLTESSTLKKLVLRLNQSSGKTYEPGVLEQLTESPRLSSLCQFEVLDVVPTPNPWPEGDYQFKSFELVSTSESLKVDIDVVFGATGGATGVLNLKERENVCEFLSFVSNVRDMTISSKNLESIYHHSRAMNPRFKFRVLTRLRASMSSNSSPQMLPVILEMCPNLRHLTLELVGDSVVTEGESGLLNVLPHCLVSSLISVDIKSPITDKATEVELVRYLLENSTTLQKLVLRLNQSCPKNDTPGFLKQLFESPRRSSLCQIVIL
ncbi:unnamed protein product [Thlaspi arvense]|uniref:FBD domain-containing protein n=1 Tax=Thlaspi arvense TaxID=13288 RepID=A0AAU9STI7_THLAR|nr:unnamed protein product [Thlaspi arvense]